MNKKFSTLVAGLAMLTAVSANAQTEPVLSVENAASVQITAAKDLTKFVHLVSGEFALSVGTNDKGQLEVQTIKKTELDAAKVASALWEVKAGVKDPATGTATYVFANKATGAVLNFDTKANKKAPILVAGSTDWVWSVSGTTMTNAAKKVAIVVGTDGKVTVEEKSSSTIIAWKSATYFLTAAGLNDFYGESFALTFDKDIDGNPFTATSLKAEEITDGSAGSTENFVRLNIPGTKKYVSVDTTLYTRQGIHQILGDDGIGYKLTTDTLVSNKTADKDHVISTKPSYLYNFRFTLNPSAADNEGLLIVELKTPVKQDKKGSKFTKDENYDADGVLTSASDAPAFFKTNVVNYLSWTLFEDGSKYLSTSVTDAVVPPVITFKAGNYADVKDGAYYWIDARNFVKKYELNPDGTPNTNGEYKWVRNTNYGKYYVAVENCETTVASKTVAKNAYAYMANTQWAVNSTSTGKGAYSIVNREFNEIFDNVKLYDLGNNTYAVGGRQDTIKLVPVTGTDKFVGYKNFTEAEAHELVFGLKVASGIADAFVGDLNDDGILKLMKASELNEEGVQKFTLEKVGQTYQLNGNTKDSLVYNIYALKSGNKYLGDAGEDFALTKKTPEWAYAFKATEKAGEYKMFIYQMRRHGEDEGSDLAGKLYSVPVDMETGLVITGSLDDLEEGEDYEWIQAYEACSDGAKAAGSVSDGKFTWTGKCDTRFADRFSIVAEPKAEYATLEEGHKNFSTTEDDAKFLTMFTDGSAVLKMADQAMGDTTVTAENLGLWLQEANTEDVVKPLYYITTARGLSEEDQKAGLKYYLTSLVDSVKVGKYTGYDRTLGFVLGTAQGDSALAIVSTKDSVAIEASPAAVAFELTNVEGYYRIVIPGLQETYIKETDKFGDPVYDKQQTGLNYLAVQNNVLYLTDRANAYLFNVTPTEMCPTNNESIDADAAVKVIAGNGVVTVMGAAGQNVTIATVLGKVVANETIASDNATIAAPAGVVFVTVNGETTKVVVK